MEENRKLVYHFNGIENYEWVYLVFVSICLFFVCFIISSSLYSLVIFLPFLCLGWYNRYKAKSSYSIYTDRIELYNENRPTDKDVISIKDIAEAKDIDKDGDGSVWFVYIRLNDDHGNKSKKINNNNEVKLRIENEEPIENIIKIFRCFKEENEVIKISDENEIIKEALG